jgi:hypothetical protein
VSLVCTVLRALFGWLLTAAANATPRPPRERYTRTLHEKGVRLDLPTRRSVPRSHLYGLAGTIHVISCIRTPANLPFPEAGRMKWREVLTARLNVTLARS